MGSPSGTVGDVSGDWGSLAGIGSNRPCSAFTFPCSHHSGPGATSDATPMWITPSRIRDYRICRDTRSAVAPTSGWSAARAAPFGLGRSDCALAHSLLDQLDTLEEVLGLRELSDAAPVTGSGPTSALHLLTTAVRQGTHQQRCSRRRRSKRSERRCQRCPATTGRHHAGRLRSSSGHRWTRNPSTGLDLDSCQPSSSCSTPRSSHGEPRRVVACHISMQSSSVRSDLTDLAVGQWRWLDRRFDTATSD